MSIQKHILNGWHLNDGEGDEEEEPKEERPKSDIMIFGKKIRRTIL